MLLVVILLLFFFGGTGEKTGSRRNLSRRYRPREMAISTCATMRCKGHTAPCALLHARVFLAHLRIGSRIVCLQERSMFSSLLHPSHRVSSFLSWCTCTKLAPLSQVSDCGKESYCVRVVQHHHAQDHSTHTLKWEQKSKKRGIIVGYQHHELTKVPTAAPHFGRCLVVGCYRHVPCTNFGSMFVMSPQLPAIICLGRASRVDEQSSARGRVLVF